MKRSQTPFLIALGAILALLVLVNELGKKAPDDGALSAALQRDYSSPYLGFSLALPPGWTLSESISAQRKRLMTTLEVTQMETRTVLTLRATEMPWDYFTPLAESAPGSGDAIVVGGREGLISPAGRKGRAYVSFQAGGVIVELLGSRQAVDTVISALHWLLEDGQPRPELPFSRTATPPARVRRWADECRSLDVSAFGSVLHEAGRSYVYVASGVRPTGGYRCTISRIVRTGATRVVVFADFERPGLDEIVTQAYSYPSDLVQIDEPGLTAQFFGDGNDAPPVIATLADTAALKPIHNQSRTIKIFSPAPEAVVEKAVPVAGLVHGSVERLFLRLLDGRGEGASTRSQAVELSPHWRSFADTLALPEPRTPGETVHLELYAIDDASGDVVDLVRIPLQNKRSK